MDRSSFQEKISSLGYTMESMATLLGVSRKTLYNYLDNRQAHKLFEKKEVVGGLLPEKFDVDENYITLLKIVSRLYSQGKAIEVSQILFEYRENNYGLLSGTSEILSFKDTVNAGNREIIRLREAFLEVLNLAVELVANVIRLRERKLAVDIFQEWESSEKLSVFLFNNRTEIDLLKSFIEQGLYDIQNFFKIDHQFQIEDITLYNMCKHFYVLENSSLSSLLNSTIQTPDYVIPFFTVSDHYLISELGAGKEVLDFIIDRNFYDFMMISAPGMKGDFAVTAWGDSMFPRFESGDILICKLFENPKEKQIKYGQVYLLSINKEAIIGIVRKSAREDEGFIKIEFFNSNYDSFEILINENNFTVATVKGTIKRFSM
ncbi:S24 family peptidase [Parasegetibacter sp. NRK P23]|uniref:S24 family peptidase n=1 Tax=Parasegetibacter sp. NRK P23 TaxID=2942999 RepID=UPI00204375C4|nr:S24 family peptidase [Parasegetibacter sp. NRK P23]MCM5528944.1 S24 family peptidase [Parasegetibacter sp. NRK P23]